MEDKETSVKRLEIIKDAMIHDYLTEIDFDDDEKITLAYDSMLYKVFVSGEFDDIFLSEYLDDLDKDERQRVIDLARKYNSLCFFHGSFDYWLDSVEGVTSSKDGQSTIAIILLRNYDYLMRLARNGGEEVLKFLNKFQGTELSKKGSIIALLRNGFCDDDTLENTLIEMTKEDGIYKDFSDTQKMILCNYPEGLLYKKNNDNKVELIPVSELKKSIENEGFDLKDIDSSSFEEIVEGIYRDYYGATYKKVINT
ncbi:MAG: hypothetical protein IK137_00365 [Bacilli bacterium]|nr:hypothetical protein [Bacilli bacterium]